MKLLEILVGILILTFVFSFGLTIFLNSSKNINNFKHFLIGHTSKISQISNFEIDTGACTEKVFTGTFLNTSLTGYFCFSGNAFNWFLK